ncbi:DUF6461 domain-containing protein [Micromonosporaceae bacterium Da 78-11]
MAADYGWFAGEPDFGSGFCFSWVHGLGPKDVLERVDGTELERVTWEQLVGSGDGQVAGADRSFFGAARVDDWVLIVEDGGGLGVADTFVRPLSVGTRVVSHYLGDDGRGQFLVLADQRVELDFDPGDPRSRTGSLVAELSPVLRAVGFDPAPGAELGGQGSGGRSVAAAFALAERITGVAMTRALLHTKTYLLATAPRPPAGAR